MNARSILLVLLFLSQGAGAATPSLDDYARGITVAPTGPLPLVEATLPDIVYATVTRADLGDLRVFNADGAAIPHALCAAPAALEPAVSEQPLPVFELRKAARGAEGSRVERADGGQPLLINGVVGELLAARRDVEPRWFMPDTVASNAADTMRFDTGRLAPVRYARLRLPQDNSSVRISLESRADEHATWQERWAGESYVIVNQTERRESPPARFEPTTDRHWRVRIVMPAATQRPTSLELGYLPARLRFLAQGPGPYTVAFGSRRTEAASPLPCDGLLADVSARDREPMIAEGLVSDVRELGGDTAFTPAPKQTPVRLVVLWSVLIAGVGLLIAMALALLGRLRSPEEGA